jgi:type IV secretory pathway ATPase VirB11/archaellum biosynthesis ATPase
MKYKIRDCANCNGLNDISFKQCFDCVKPSPELDLIIYKNKTFTKQHYLKDNRFVVYPFFVDVLIKPVNEKAKVLSSYRVKDATVNIVELKENVQPVYALGVEYLEKSFDELIKLRTEFDRGNFSSELLKIWIKQHGILDYLLSDPRIQEININPPEFQTPFTVVHEDFDECLTNIFPSIDFLNYLSTYLKIESGRPLNKSQPQLDGELFVENQRARVAAVVEPFSVHGIGYSIRKHREKPWTLPLFIANNTVSPLFAGLMSFVLTHGRTFVIAGPRGSGKTAMLGSVITEILPKYRIITIEDTKELPVDYYKGLGYDLLSLKVRSALMDKGLEIPYDRGLRTSLRLGDSFLIVGEIRSKEAKVLYEAMRVGALSHSVAGTIHADTPYGVFDRVVNDLGVPRGSFKVTDFIIIENQIKTAAALHRKRRILKVVEVLKDWKEEPKFQELMVYNPKTDSLEATSVLLEGKSAVINDVISRVKGYSKPKDAVNDIMLRAWAKELHVKLSEGMKDKMEADFNLRLNVSFSKLFEEIEPIKSPKKMEEFKKEFEKIATRILKL